jgi:hypothetical protein
MGWSLGNLAWETIRNYLWTDPITWSAIIAVVMGILAILWNLSLPMVLLVAIVSLASALVIWNQTTILMGHQGPVATQSATANPTVQFRPVAFDADGFRWWATERFFKVYEAIEAPNPGLIDSLITGPSCPRCLRSLVGFETVGIQVTHVVRKACRGCGATFPGGKVLYHAKLSAYHTAQAMALREELKAG